MTVKFVKINQGWTADPNAPDPTIQVENPDIVLSFFLNAQMYPIFKLGDYGAIRFANCSRYRLDGLNNMDAWYFGQCRFSKLAPEWGEFYSVTGDSAILDAPNDWVEYDISIRNPKHFLFYFRDHTFECTCENWIFERSAENALLQLGQRSSS